MDPWLTVLIPLIAGAIIITVANRIASHSFKCKHCSQQFRIQWPKVLITEHSGPEYKLLCPHCNTKDWCTQLPKKEP